MVEAKPIINEYRCGKCNKKYSSEEEANNCCQKEKIDWTNANKFELKQVHLDLFKEMYVDWDDCEFGAPAINPKRPYGNSDVFEFVIYVKKERQNLLLIGGY